MGQLDWDRNVDTHFKQHHFLEPVVDATVSTDECDRPLDRVRPRGGPAALQCEGTDAVTGGQVRAARSGRQRLDYRPGLGTPWQLCHCRHRP